MHPCPDDPGSRRGAPAVLLSALQVLLTVGPLLVLSYSIGPFQAMFADLGVGSRDVPGPSILSHLVFAPPGAWILAAVAVGALAVTLVCQDERSSARWIAFLLMILSVTTWLLTSFLAWQTFASVQLRMR